jgi:two-component system phosphate regulon sensor histidine kinase PhoR
VHAAARLPAPGAAAVVLLSAPQGEVEAVIRSIRARLLAATGAALVLGLLLSLTAGRVVSAPLRTMTRVARQLASGSRGERLRLPPGDELGDLAAALDRMGAERARSVEELESEKEQLRGVLDGMAEGVLLLGLSGRILLANGAARAALPHGEELVGRTPLEVTRSPELDALVQEARGAGGAPARGQVTLAGGTRAFDASVIPLAGADGGLIIVLHEITELKRLETVRREFVANISHELRTPLTAIRGFIDTLADDPDLAAADRERFLAAAGRHVHRLSNLVDDLLALARLDSPEYQLDLVPCDLQTAIANAIELHSGGARERQVAVRGEVEPGLPPVSADPGALDQILSNLINNAIKYNRAGGRVVVRAVQAGDLVRVAVEDSGVGIAAVHLPRIFERLYRVDPGRSRAEGGTGLGLAIVKHLVLKHGGDVWVTSEPGVGSTFWFTLRLVLGAKAARS